MKRLTTVAGILVAAALTAACGGGSSGGASQESAPPGPVTEYKNQLPGQTVTRPIDLIQTVIDFAPGAKSVVHKHTSPNLATVLKGQVTVTTPTGDKQASAGESLVEPLNQPVQATNTASGETMVAVAFIVPHGGKASVPVAGQPAPATPNKTLYNFTFATPSVSGGCTLVQEVLDFAPGAQTSKHHDGGPGVITVIQGQMTVSSDGAEKTYGAGDSFTEMPGQTLQEFNRGSSELLVVAIFVLPDGAQLSTNL
jgi:quercetin dioxygenase-like cupin family protein